MPTSIRPKRPAMVEWGTLGLFVVCMVVWAVALFGLAQWSVGLAAPLICLALVLHSSISHEALHGHPFASSRANAALVIVSPGLFVPYERFRDTHLAHHHDARLTDPYDDPESNYLDPDRWSRLPRFARVALNMNNTLLGRIVLGPAISQVVFMVGDWRLIRAGDRAVLRAWAIHLAGCAWVLVAVALSAVSMPVYLALCYVALSVLKIRTFAEHQAHLRARARSVIVEDHGVLAFLFLNNNLHAVHHMHPSVPWYRLPAIYRANKARYQACNDGYVIRSYAQVFARYFLRRKDPVPHPLWSRDD